MLENAVHNIAELRQFNSTAELERAKTGQDLNYDQYLRLLTSSASSYDNQKVARPSRQVYSHDIPGTLDLSHDHDEYDDNQGNTS